MTQNTYIILAWHICPQDIFVEFYGKADVKTTYFKGIFVVKSPLFPDKGALTHHPNEVWAVVLAVGKPCALAEGKQTTQKPHCLLWSAYLLYRR